MVYALVVIYNKSCSKSCTIASLQKSERDEIRVIVFDNSTSNFLNSEFCREHGYIYYGFQKNFGISKAYNYVIDRLDKSSGHIIILDDDTEFDESFIHEIMYIDSHNDTLCVYLPVVNAKLGNKVKMISPSNIWLGCTSRMLTSLSKIDYNRITAINSGMFINLKIFNLIRYNENLFLDCVDHCFMKMIREKEIPVKILYSTIKQNYSRGEHPSLTNALHRYKLFRKDLSTYSEICNNRLFYYAFIVKHTLLNTIRYKNFSFLKILFQ